MNQKAWIIYLEKETILSKKAYADWREIQAEYRDDFVTALEPMCCEDVIAYFAEEYPDSVLFAEQKIRDFFAGDAPVLRPKK